VSESAEAYSERPWYAVRVVTRREASVTKAFEEAGFQTWLPVTKKETKWSDRVVTRETVVLPGYVFVRFPYLTPELFATIRFPVAGVVKVLGSNEKPVAIPIKEIEDFRRVLDSGTAVIACNFEKGAKVIVVKGPLTGQYGTVVKSKGITRVIFALELLHRAVSVEIDANHIAAAA
jgi:transcription termination/antitermination protein NusG